MAAWTHRGAPCCSEYRTCSEAYLLLGNTVTLSCSLAVAGTVSSYMSSCMQYHVPVEEVRAVQPSRGRGACHGGVSWTAACVWESGGRRHASAVDEPSAIAAASICTARAAGLLHGRSGQGVPWAGRSVGHDGTAQQRLGLPSSPLPTASAVHRPASIAAAAARASPQRTAAAQSPPSEAAAAARTHGTCATSHDVSRWTWNVT